MFLDQRNNSPIATAEARLMQSLLQLLSRGSLQANELNTPQRSLLTTQANQRGTTLDDLLQLMTAKPTNNTVTVRPDRDGRLSEADRAAYDRGNPYLPSNWELRPEDREGFRDSVTDAAAPTVRTPGRAIQVTQLTLSPTTLSPATLSPATKITPAADSNHRDRAATRGAFARS